MYACERCHGAPALNGETIREPQRRHVVLECLNYRREEPDDFLWPDPGGDL
jgi:hypothetical protein